MMQPTNELLEHARPVDLLGNPIPQASIGGPQGYLMDTRPDTHPTESAKLASLRAAATKDAPALLDTPAPDEWKLLGSSGTLKGIFGIIEKYYFLDASSPVNLAQGGHTGWYIVEVSGKTRENVRVIYRAGRYRFELRA